MGTNLHLHSLILKSRRSKISLKLAVVSWIQMLSTRWVEILSVKNICIHFPTISGRIGTPLAFAAIRISRHITFWIPRPCLMVPVLLS